MAEDDGMVAEAICDRLTEAGVEVVARADTGVGAVEGLGLRTMQYRASMIGARFEIAPFRPQGTRVICDCPQGG